MKIVLSVMGLLCVALTGNAETKSYAQKMMDVTLREMAKDVRYSPLRVADCGGEEVYEVAVEFEKTKRAIVINDEGEEDIGIVTEWDVVKVIRYRDFSAKPFICEPYSDSHPVARVSKEKARDIWAAVSAEYQDTFRLRAFGPVESICGSAEPGYVGAVEMHSATGEWVEVKTYGQTKTDLDTNSPYVVEECLE